MSTAPTTLLGLVPLIRALVNSATDATATTVTADDSGSLFIDKSTSTHTYTLPAIALGAGKAFMFFKLGTGTMTIASAGSLDNIVAFNDVAADSVSFGTTNEKIGGAMLIIGDGTYWYAMNMSAGANTVTVA